MEIYQTLLARYGRLCDRYPMPAGRGYDTVKAYFEAGLSKSKEIKTISTP